MPDKQSITITLSPDRVIAPIFRAIRDTADVMRICVAAIANADFEKVEEDAAFQRDGERLTLRFRFSGDARSSNERTATCLNWLLAKAFQEYARGIRAAIERAFEFISGEGGGKFGQWDGAMVVP